MKEDWSDNCKRKHRVELDYERAKNLFKNDNVIVKIYAVFSGNPLYIKVYNREKRFLFSCDILLFEIKKEYIRVVDESSYKLALKFAKKYDYDLIKDWCQVIEMVFIQDWLMVENIFNAYMQDTFGFICFPFKQIEDIKYYMLLFYEKHRSKKAIKKLVLSKRKSIEWCAKHHQRGIEMVEIDIDAYTKKLCQCRKCKSIFLINDYVDTDNSKWLLIEKQKTKLPLPNYTLKIYKCKKCDEQVEEIGEVVTDIYQVIEMGKCKKCGKELKKWYSATGGKEIMGCSDIKCNYKEEQNDSKEKYQMYNMW